MAASQTPGDPAESDPLALALREHRAGRLPEAAAAYRKVLAIRPENPDAYNNLGVILWQQGNFEEAATHYQQALALRPDYVDVRGNLGTLLLGQGKLDQAAIHFQYALALRPDNADIHNNLGIALWRQGKLDEAAAHFEQAIAIRPDDVDPHSNLGSVLLSQGKLGQALQRYQQALALRPNNPEAHNNLGVVLRRQGKLDQALASYEQAIALRPNYAEAHNNLGNVLKQLGQLDQALARFEHALALRPNYADAHNNVAVILWQQNKLDEAAARYEQALALKPDLAEAQTGLAAASRRRKLRARLAPLRSATALAPALAAARSSALDGPAPGRPPPAAAGRARLGRRAPVRPLCPAAQGAGALIVLAVPAALGRLLAGHPDGDESFIVGSATDLPRCDFYLPLLSAPCVLGTTAATIPCELPYLSADPELTDQWRRELAAIDGFKIGIVWQGSRHFHLDCLRSFPLAHFAPLARLPGVRLVSLQKGFGSQQAAAVDFPLLDLSDRLDEAAGPLMDTAAVIRNLDLVVTPDTAIAHLAGALGARVWVALQLSPDWRWLRSATTHRGIPRCDSSAKPHWAAGRKFSIALPTRFGRAARKWDDLRCRGGTETTKENHESRVYQRLDESTQILALVFRGAIRRRGFRLLVSATAGGGQPSTTLQI